MKKLLGLVFFIFTIIFMLTNISAQDIDVNWINNLDEALEKARIQDKNIFIFFTAPSWCTYCNWMEENTFTSDKVQKMLNENFISLKIKDTDEIIKEFGIEVFPTIKIFNKNVSHERLKIEGKVEPDKLYNVLNSILLKKEEKDMKTDEGCIGGSCDGD